MGVALGMPEENFGIQHAFLWFARRQMYKVVVYSTLKSLNGLENTRFQAVIPFTLELNLVVDSCRCLWFEEQLPTKPV